MLRFLKEYWGLLTIGLFFSLVWMGTRVRKAKYAQKQRFTVAEAYDTHWTMKAGQYVDARFYAGRQRYIVSASASSLTNTTVKGRCFLVKYHPPDPNISELYLKVPVSDTIKPPVEGWEKPPFPVPAEVLE